MFGCGMLTFGSTCLRQPLYSKIRKLWQMATCFWVHFSISFVFSACTMMFIEKHCLQLWNRRRPLLHYCAHMQTEAESICFPLESLMSLQFPSLTDALDVYVRRVVPDRTFAYWCRVKKKALQFCEIANISSVILPHAAHCRQCMRSLCDSNSVFCMRVMFFCSVHIASLCSLLIQASH